MELKKLANGKPLVQSWFKHFKSKASEGSCATSECEVIGEKTSLVCTEDVEGENSCGGENNEEKCRTRKRRPEQEKIEESMNVINKRIADLVSARAAGLLTQEHSKELKKLKRELSVKKTKLKRLSTLRKAQVKHRNKQRKILKALRQSDPEKLADVTVQEEPGRPRLEESQPGLLDAIVDIVQTYASADQKRRTETMRYVKTLDQLLVELKEMGKMFFPENLNYYNFILL